MGLKHTKDNVVYGFHAVESILKRNQSDFETIFLDQRRNDNRIQKLIRMVDRNIVSLNFTDRKSLDGLCGHGNHQGVVGTLNNHQTDSMISLAGFLSRCGEHSLVLILDHIQDPRNLGACLRVADGAGVDAVILPKDGASPINDTVRKVSSGAVESTNILFVTNLARTISDLKAAQFWIYGADDGSDVLLYDCEFSQRTAIVMGEEGRGLKRLTRESCDQLISIPMYGAVSSLNVSVATGIVLYEIKRRI